jgi:DNA ligase-1
MSEKLDGVRAYWNGNSLISRHGNNIMCPPWFTQELPTGVALDGELWMGRGTFELLLQVLNYQDDPSWSNVSYIIFDLPGSKESYEKRIAQLTHLKLPNHVQKISIRQCRGSGHIREYLGEVLEHGGEGLMINNPDSSYISLRTNTLLKVKVCLVFRFLCSQAASRCRSAVIGSAPYWTLLCAVG